MPKPDKEVTQIDIDIRRKKALKYTHCTKCKAIIAPADVYYGYHLGCTFIMTERLCEKCHLTMVNESNKRK